MRNRIGIAVLVFVAGFGAPAAAQNDADMQELQSYRLTMAGIQKLSVAMRTLFEEMKKDPKVQEMTTLSADIKALESKDEMTEAEENRLVAMKAKKEEIEEAVGGGMNVGNEKTLSEMETKVKQSEVLMRGLRAAGLSPREYAKLSMSMVTSAMYAGMKKSGMLKELPKEASVENVQFVLDHEAELTAMQKEWAALSGTEK